MKLIYFLLFTAIFTSCEKEFPTERNEYSFEDEDLDLSTDSVYSYTDGVIVED